jgi:replicative DNA helicase
VNAESRPKAAPEVSVAATSTDPTAEGQHRPLIDPAEAYLGALLQLPAESARDAAAFIASLDLADPRHQIVYRLCRELAGRGVAPDPAAVFAEAGSSGAVAGAHRLGALSTLLANLYTRGCVAPSVRFYAAAILADALRRRVEQAGQRLQQVAAESSITDTLAMVGSETAAVAELARRWRVIAFIEAAPAAVSFWDALADSAHDSVVAA